MGNAEVEENLMVVWFFYIYKCLMNSFSPIPHVAPSPSSCFEFILAIKNFPNWKKKDNMILAIGEV